MERLPGHRIVLIVGMIVLVACLPRLLVKQDGGAPQAVPQVDQANPGIAPTGEVSLECDGRSWTEEFDALATAMEALAKQGHVVVRRESCLVHEQSGLILRPLLVEVQPSPGGEIRTATTVSVSHPEVFPAGVFEYQHSNGTSVNESIRAGFEQWAKVDLVVLLEALRPEPESCMTLNMTFPGEDGTPDRCRRVILGPVAHFAAREAPSSAGPADEEHPFCSCCLFTHTAKAFDVLLRSDGFCAIRFYSARDQDGNAMADCRVNGEDCEEGAQALRNYVATWPQRGFEFRKQYVVIQTVAQFVED